MKTLYQVHSSELKVMQNLLTDVRVNGCHWNFDSVGHLMKMYWPGRALNPFLDILSSITRDGWLTTYKKHTKYGEKKREKYWKEELTNIQNHWPLQGMACWILVSSLQEMTQIMNFGSNNRSQRNVNAPQKEQSKIHIGLWSAPFVYKKYWTGRGTGFRRIFGFGIKCTQGRHSNGKHYVRLIILLFKISVISVTLPEWW